MSNGTPLDIEIRKRIAAAGPMPNAEWPSDHLPVGAVLRLPASLAV